MNTESWTVSFKVLYCLFSKWWNSISWFFLMARAFVIMPQRFQDWELTLFPEGKIYWNVGFMRVESFCPLLPHSTCLEKTCWMNENLHKWHSVLKDRYISFSRWKLSGCFQWTKRKGFSLFLRPELFNYDWGIMDIKHVIKYHVNSGKMWSVVFTLKTKIRNDSVFLKKENGILTF